MCRTGEERLCKHSRSTSVRKLAIRPTVDRQMADWQIARSPERTGALRHACAMAASGSGRRMTLNELSPMDTHFYLIGVDGGGTGTRVVLGDAQGRELAIATSGPSGLALGVERAWQSSEAGRGGAVSRAGLAL